MPPAASAFSRRDTVLFVSCIVAAFAAIQLPDRIRDPFASALRQSILAPLVSLQSDAEQSRRSWLTREVREAQRDSIALRSMSLDASLADNDRLRKLLGLGQALAGASCRPRCCRDGAWARSTPWSLSAGSKAGILPFSPVVAPEGLVGMVKSVDPTMSIAIAWAHPDFRVSAMAADGGAFGIVGAHLGNEPERYLLEMRGVPMRSNLAPGSLIVSSGLGGTFPRGIPVGTVIAEMKTSEPWARTYLLRPAVAPADVTDVMVLLPARTTAGVPNVWKVGLHADSAVKSIVAAGDSLAKLQVRRDSAAAPRDTTTRRDSARVVTAARRDTARSVTGVKVVPSAQSEVRPSRVPPAPPAPTTTTP